MKKDKKEANPEDQKSDQSPTFSEKLYEALTAYYSPAENPRDADETKSTQELIEEMGSMQEVFPWEINQLMYEGGFKLQYTGSSYEWLLKKK